MTSVSRARLLGLLLASGCAAAAPPLTPEVTPAIEAISTTHAAVGERIVFDGSGLLDRSEGWVDLTLRGEFVPAGTEEREPVELTVPLRPEADGSLIWHRFGAYRVPFGRGDRIGVFVGTMSAVNHYLDGRTVPQDEGTELLVRFTVDPSIVILEHRAFGGDWFADCQEPATTIMGEMFYATRALAVGFEVESLRWTIGPGLLVDGNAREMSTQIDVPQPGSEQGLVTRFAAVPVHNDGYATGISVVMTDSSGVPHRLDLPLMVRRPLQAYFVTPFLTAEVYPAVLIQGPVLGTPAGTTMRYEESRTETRARQIELSVATGWQESYGMEHTESRELTDQETFSTEREREIRVADATTMGGEETVSASSSVTAGRSATSSVDFTQTGSSSWDATVSVSQGREMGRTDTRSEAEGWNRGVNGEISGMASGEAGIPFVANGEVGVGARVGGEAGWNGQTTEGYTDSSSSSIDVTQSGRVGGGYEESLRRGASMTDSMSRTDELTRSRGIHWSRTRSIEEINSFSETETVSQTRSYGEAVARTATVGRTLQEQATERFEVTSSTTTTSGTETVVYAGMVGGWYRQATRLRRYGATVAYDLCGNGSEVGVFAIDDWVWGAYPVVGESTDWPIDLTQTSVPPPRCILPPCEGY